MKTQLVIQSTGAEPIIIDVIDDESVQVHLDTHPNRFMPEPTAPTFNVSGLRWRGDKHHHLGWVTRQLALGESINISYVSGNAAPTTLEKEVEYVVPEMTCNFCDRPASQVECLVERTMLARICDECVRTCQAEIDKRKTDRDL
jgi:hypothetical protein